MANYVSQATQTLIGGLVHDPAPHPASLTSRRPIDDTPPEDTSPEDKGKMAIDKLQLPAERTPSMPNPNLGNPYASPAMLLRKKGRPRLEARISMPKVTQFDPDNPHWPPPTEAVMSPLPAANLLYAGHTPILPRSRSPFVERNEEINAPMTPDQDEALSGPLTLPLQPGGGDGVDDVIPLSVLDAQLEKIRIEQESYVNPEPEQVPPSNMDLNFGIPEVRRQSADEVVDGVILKKQRLNFGAPLGQA
jgi:hypothetical protein